MVVVYISIKVDQLSSSVLSGNKYVLFLKRKHERFVSRTIVPVLQKEYFHVYAHHNVEYYPGALFLRNWAVECVNKALRQVSCTFSPFRIRNFRKSENIALTVVFFDVLRVRGWLNFCNEL